MQYLVSRHAGAIEWCRRQPLNIDHVLSHLDENLIQPGDWVIGTLPLPMVAAIQRRGARYLHLNVPVSAELRGQELSADQLEQLGASLQEYRVEAL